MLGLCLTECTHGNDSPGIVGTWTAIEVDMEKFPMIEMGEGYVGRYGIELRVHADLSASFGYYGAYSSHGVGQRVEQHMPATVDADDAPRYLIAVEYYGHSYYGEGEGDVDEDLPGVAAQRIELVGPGVLRSRPTPQAADNTRVFDCNLSGDRLDCTLDAGDEGPTKWKFARQTEET